MQTYRVVKALLRGVGSSSSKEFCNLCHYDRSHRSSVYSGGGLGACVVSASLHFQWEASTSQLCDNVAIYLLLVDCGGGGAPFS